MGVKIVFIGGGSYGWTPTLARDLFVRESLRGSELVLVDINQGAALELQNYCQELAKRFDCDWKISVAGLDAALPGADVVCASIAVGGLEAMHNDYHIPEEFGVYHCVGDTVGPGGISRTLRHVPVFVDFARKMERFCPDAPLIHVTNPLSQITRAVSKATSIKCIGLCHNFAGTMAFLANYFGVPKSEIEAQSVGVNHYTWLQNLTCQGRPVHLEELTTERYLQYQANKHAPLITNTTDDEINAVLNNEKLPYGLNFELCELFGAFPVGESSHVVENFAFYCNNTERLEKHGVRRKGVLPRRQTLADRAKQRLRDTLAGKHDWPSPELSDEGFSGIVESLTTGAPSRALVSMPNAGQVANLPHGTIVETWAQISKGTISPTLGGSIPEHLTGMMRLIVDEQELTVEAALTGNLSLIEAALTVSPLLHDKDRAPELARRLLEANRNWLPQFFAGKN